MSKKIAANKKSALDNSIFGNGLELSIASISVGISTETVRELYGLKQKYNSWDLGSFMATPPATSTVYKARRVVEILSLQ